MEVDWRLFLRAGRARGIPLISSSIRKVTPSTVVPNTPAAGTPAPAVAVVVAVAVTVTPEMTVAVLVTVAPAMTVGIGMN
jgi:hypothetical protein